VKKFGNLRKLQKTSRMLFVEEVCGIKAAVLDSGIDWIKFGGI
jgi:hypothetical protein